MQYTKQKVNSEYQASDQVLHYVVCATQRTGSTFLCEALENLNLIQDPDCFYEALYPKNKEGTLFHTTPPDQYLKVWLREVEQYGVAGCKVMSHQLREHISIVSQINLRNALALFPTHTHFIWIQRRDKLRQAVSMRRASVTHVWRKTQKNMNRVLPDCCISDTDIDAQVYELKKDEKYLKKFFQKAKVKPLVLYYEDFQDDRSEAVQYIIEYLGIKIDNPVIGEAALIQQSDEKTEQLVYAYRGILTKPYLVQETWFYCRLFLERAYKMSAFFRKKSALYEVMLDSVKQFVGIVFRKS